MYRSFGPPARAKHETPNRVSTCTASSTCTVVAPLHTHKFKECLKSSVIYTSCYCHSCMDQTDQSWWVSSHLQSEDSILAVMIISSCSRLRLLAFNGEQTDTGRRMYNDFTHFCLYSTNRLPQPATLEIPQIIFCVDEGFLYTRGDLMAQQVKKNLGGVMSPTGTP